MSRIFTNFITNRNKPVDNVDPNQQIEMIVTFPLYKPFRRINQSFRSELTKTLKFMQPRKGLKHKPVVDELNQFLFSNMCTNNMAYLEIPTRILMEDRVDAIYAKFSTKILNELHKLYRKDPELTNSLKAVADANQQLSLGLDKEIDKIRDLPDHIIEEIDKIFKNGSLIIWDMPGVEIDRIIAGYEKINREGDSLSEADIGTVSDELTLATFGKQHVPVLVDQVNRINDCLAEFPTRLATFLDGFTSISSEKEKELLVEVASVFLGKLLGIREPVNLAQKQLNRYLELESELKQEGAAIGSSFLTDIYKQLIIKEDAEKALQITEEIMELVSDHSEDIRQILVKIENQDITGESPEVITKFVSFVSQLYYDLEEFRFITETFQDIPSFTAMGGGVAMETGYTGDFDIPEDTAIYMSDIFRTFPLINHTVYALRGIDLDVKKGEFVSIMGPSGSGKTTLLNIMSSLDKPDRGIVYVDGINLNAASEKELVQFRRDNVAFIYQSYNLLPILTNQENVSLPADFGTNNPIGNAKKRAGEILDSVGLERYKKTKPLLLSGGQQQRVTIARALMNKPAIIFADEPTGDLDSVTGGQVMDLIEELHKEGVTVIVVTHDETIAKRAERIIYMGDGKIIDK
jgi:putative ABC transport system ATP-binding protein